MKKFLKCFLMLAVKISAVTAVVAFIAFIAERIEELKTWRTELKHKPYGIYEKFVKRPLDCYLSTGALIVFSPILVVIAILVKIKLGSPVLFIQERPGRNEKIFKLYKFRTMTDERDENGNLLPDSIRLTRFGNVLRQSSLDELPELFNIIKGDMAVVGPRPLMKGYLKYYDEREHGRHLIRPGLTGYAQVHGRNAVSWEDRMNQDLYYKDHITFINDFKIVVHTILLVLKREGVSNDNMEDFDVYKMNQKNI